MTSQSGSGSTPAGTAGGVLGGTYPSPTFASNGTSRILDLLTALLGTAVTMTNANQLYDGPSLTLTAGSWLVTVGLTLNQAAGSAGFTGVLWDGVTKFVSGEVVTVAGNTPGQIVLQWAVFPVTSTTYKGSAACTTAGATIATATFHNGQGNTATWITALRIG